MNLSVLVVLLAYMVVMLGVGLYFSRKDMNEEDFLLGGKKLPGWSLAFSERATAESVWLILGATGFVFSKGLSSIWLIAGNLAGALVVWLFVAKKVMRETDRYNSLTLPDFFSTKFERHAALIRWFSGLLIVFFFSFYVAAQFAGAGKTLHTTFGITKETGILISGVIVIIYASMGGFMSVVWTDVVQSLLMLGTLVILPIVAWFKIQSLGLNVGEALVAAGPGMDSWSSGLTGFALGVMIFSSVSWFFGFLGGQPQLAARFMAMRSERDADTARNVAVIWSLLAYFGVFAIGIFGLVLYGKGGIPDPEMLVPHMLTDLLPGPVAGLLLAGIVAAMMSTADSQLLVLTSSITEDVLHKALGIKLEDRQLVLIARLCVITSGLFGLIIAFISKSLIFSIVSYAWAGIGCTFSATLLLALFWQRASSAGIAASLIMGFITTIAWAESPLDAIIATNGATFFVTLGVGILVSLLKPDHEESAEPVNAVNFEAEASK